MKILVYDDNADYGGHQAMACHGIEALAVTPGIEIACMLSPANHRLVEKLGRFETHEAPATAQQVKQLERLKQNQNHLNGGAHAVRPGRRRLPLQGFGHSGRSISLSALNPDLVLCIQGDIGQSSRGIAAARQAGIECVSYLALPHTLRSMGAKLGAVRDLFNKRLLNLPSRYIVISEGMEKLLRDRGATVPIDIVPNGIPAPPAPNVTAHGSWLILGLLGRVEFKQKRQDFMVDTFLQYPEEFADSRLLLAGNGPDDQRLARRVEGRQNIVLQPWQEDTEAFYNAIDMLVIPSRYEGVPLVMLEALARGIPVIGSRCDGMRDILPEAWTFEPGNAAALAETFARVRDTWRKDIDTLRERVTTDASLENFKQRFCTVAIGSR